MPSNLTKFLSPTICNSVFVEIPSISPNFLYPLEISIATTFNLIPNPVKKSISISSNCSLMKLNIVFSIFFSRFSDSILLPKLPLSYCSYLEIISSILPFPIPRTPDKSLKLNPSKSLIYSIPLLWQ